MVTLFQHLSQIIPLIFYLLLKSSYLIQGAAYLAVPISYQGCCNIKLVNHYLCMNSSSIPIEVGYRKF